MEIEWTALTCIVAVAALCVAAQADPSTPRTPSAAAVLPGVTKQDLFTARTDGYTVYRIPGVVITSKGTVLTYCEARKRNGWDWDPIDIVLRRSTDAGRTWERQHTIAAAPPDAKSNVAAIRAGKAGDWVTLNNPVMIPEPDGVVHFLYCVNYGRCFYCRSTDDGVTFSTPVEITATFDKFRPEYDWKVIATGPGHGIRISTGAHAGRLLVPVWMSIGTEGHGHNPNWVASIFSDDAGKTWQRGDLLPHSLPEVTNANETTAVELSDGRIMFNTRSNAAANRRLVATSPDGASHWSPLIFDPALFDPICFASIIRLPSAPGKIPPLLFSNPDSSSYSGKGVQKPRRNLTLRLSEDDGRTWPIAKVLEPGNAGYSDLAVAAHGTVYCLYERETLKDAFDTAYLTLATIRPGWMTEK